MNREDKIEVFKMRLDGFTYQEIAEKYGVSRQYINQMLQNVISEKRNKALNKIVYPNIANWLKDNECSISEFVIRVGIKRSTLDYKLRGRNKFNSDEIKRILDVTGMKFEECLKMKESEDYIWEQRLWRRKKRQVLSNMNQMEKV